MSTSHSQGHQNDAEGGSDPITANQKTRPTAKDTDMERQCDYTCADRDRLPRTDTVSSNQHQHKHAWCTPCTYSVQLQRSKIECTRQVAIQSRGEFLPWKYRRVTWKKFGEEQQQKTGVFSTQQRTLVKKGWQAQPPAMRNRIRNAEDESQATEARCSRRPGTQLATWPEIQLRPTLRTRQ